MSENVCVLRRNLVELLKSKGVRGCHEPALVLGQALYWAERVKDLSKLIEEEKTRSELELPQFQFQHGWFYKSAQEWLQDTMLDVTDITIRKHLVTLENLGYISSRSNPIQKWDKVLQYRVNVHVIVDDLAKIDLALNGYNKLSELANCVSEAKNFDLQKSIEFGAIPENTTESTSETLKTTMASQENDLPSQPFSVDSQATTKAARGKEPKGFVLNPEGDKWQNAATRCLFYWSKLTKIQIPNDVKLKKSWYMEITKWWAEAKIEGKDEPIQTIEDRLNMAIRKTVALFKEKEWDTLDPFSHKKTMIYHLGKERTKSTMKVAYATN